MARDDPGSAAGSRQAGRPLTGAGVRSTWEVPPRGGFLPPRPLLRPGDFPLRPSGRPDNLRGIVGHPPVPASGGAGREGGGPRAVRHVVEAASRRPTRAVPPRPPGGRGTRAGAHGRRQKLGSEDDFQ
ncbi:hypothetical protein NDU88_003688 [Pleurodeles waltl]|uniref:Uncharacterized protein n=1 Tax=Pleurodeles waltl TaxID=8319 RepID=A0AAV7PIW9_PLEWA|nr:hypothetical protein NDU88_003688 [Pleurodeles waltl]